MSKLCIPMEVDVPVPDVFSLGDFKETLNEIEQKIYYEQMNPNLELHFDSQNIFMEFLKAIFQEMEDLNQQGIITKLNKYLNNNMKFPSKSQQLIMKRFYQLKIILNNYNFKNKKSLSVTFLRLYQIINWGPTLYKSNLTRTLNKKLKSVRFKKDGLACERLIDKKKSQDRSRLQRRLNRNTQKDLNQIDNVFGDLSL